MNEVQRNRELNNAEVRRGASRLESTPLQINVELTGVCDIHPPCVFCTGKNVGYSYRPLPIESIDAHAAFLDRCERVNEDSFGEPLTHPGLVRVARRFTAEGRCFSFVTNGLTLGPKKAAALAECGRRLGIHVSLNAATADTFFKLTGKELSTVVDNVRRYVEVYARRHGGERPDVTLTFIVMKVNRREVAAFLDLARELGVKALLAPLHDRPSVPLGHFGYDFRYEEEMLSFAEYRRIGREAKALAERLGLTLLLQWDATADSALRGFSEPGVDIDCLIPWRFLYIQQHSENVYGCPYHKRPIGNLARQSLAEVWNGEIATTMRRSLADGQIPQFCWDNSAACPLVFRARQEPNERPPDCAIVMGVNDHRHLGPGWHPLEELPEKIRWTSRSACFRIGARRKGSLRVELMSFKPGLSSVPLLGYLEVAGKMLKGFRLAKGGWHTLSAAVPWRYRLARRLEDQVLDARLVVFNPWRAAEVLSESTMEAVIGMKRRVRGSRDTRELGVAVRRIWME